MIETGGVDASLEPWVTPAELADTETTEDLAMVCATATEVLWHLSGREFGIWTTSERTIAEPCLRAVKALVLQSPVVEVTSVVEDGVTLTDNDWQLLGALLERTDGENWAPAVTVNYKHGVAVPLMGRTAAKALADQLVLYVRKDKRCKLADLEVSTSRQGVTHTRMDPMELVRAGKTGLYLVDTWLGTVNPTSSRSRPGTLSPYARRLR
jgi:hypothetical protein